MDANKRECEKASWVVTSGLAFIGVYSRLDFKAGQLSVGGFRGSGGSRFNVSLRQECVTGVSGDSATCHVKELLGHETLETLKPYTKLTIADLKKTHEKCHPREKNNGDT